MPWLAASTFALRAPSVELVELLPDRPAALSRCQRARARIAVAAALGAASERRHDEPLRPDVLNDTVRATNASSVRLCVASRYETQCCNDFNRAEPSCDNFAAAQAREREHPLRVLPWPTDARKIAGCAGVRNRLPQAHARNATQPTHVRRVLVLRASRCADDARRRLRCGFCFHRRRRRYRRRGRRRRVWADIGRGVIVEQRSWNSALALVN